MKHAALVFGVLLLFTAGLVAACGPGVQEGSMPAPLDTATEEIADTTSGPVDSDDTDSIEPDSTETESTDSETADGGTAPGETDSAATADTGQDWCEAATIEDRSVVTADQIIPGGTLVALDTDCVLGARPEADGYTAVLVFLSVEAEDSILLRSEQAVPLAPAAVACRFDTTAGISIAYIVTSDETQSTVYELKSDVGEWTEIFQGPHLLGIQQIYRTEPPAVDDLCVFGDGLYCADRGSDWTYWREEIAVAGGEAIRDVALVACAETRCLAAVGDTGFVSVKEQSAWRPIAADTSENLTTIAAVGVRFAVVGDGGTLLYGDTSRLSVYRILDGEDIVTFSWVDARTFKGVTAAGTVFQGEMGADGAYICPDPSHVDVPVLGGGLSHCESVTNYLVLRPDALVGTYLCAIIVLTSAAR